MGWNSGSEVFNTIAKGLVIVADAHPDMGEVLANVVASVAEHLHKQDWDVCDEVVEDWHEYPVILAGLRQAGCLDGHVSG